LQAAYAEQFTREYGCTEREWLGWLPPALGAEPESQTPSSLTLAVPPGRLLLEWQALDPLAIALVRMPRLRVGFRFEGIDEAQRYTFMRRFDLYMQRGGG
jgi:hypothetical protein